jgi:hypothetical protein
MKDNIKVNPKYHDSDYIQFDHVTNQGRNSILGDHSFDSLFKVVMIWFVTLKLHFAMFIGHVKEICNPIKWYADPSGRAV